MPHPVRIKILVILKVVLFFIKAIKKATIAIIKPKMLDRTTSKIIHENALNKSLVSFVVKVVLIIVANSLLLKNKT